MYIVITKFIRQDSNTPYYLDTDDNLKNSFIAFAEANSSLIVDLLKVDSSSTEQLNYAVYENEENFDSFMILFNEAFPTFFDDRDLYCKNNNITVERSVDVY